MLERKLGAKKTTAAFPVRTLLKRTELQQKQPMISILKTSSKCPGGRRKEESERPAENKESKSQEKESYNSIKCKKLTYALSKKKSYSSADK